MAIETHLDFLESTRPQRVVGRDRLLSEATKRTYTFMSRLVRTDYDMFQGGSKLVDKVQGTTSGNAGWYNPNDEFSPQQRDVQTPVEVNWAFHQGHYVVIDETASLNEGDPYAYVNYFDSLELDCLVSMLNDYEESLWQKPDRGKMEDTPTGNEARQMYSIPAFITRDGLAPSGSNGGLASGTNAWTTVETVDPSQETWWQNQTGTYDASAPDDPDSGLIATFDDIVLDLSFEMPDGIRKYTQDEDLQKYMICTSKDGMTFYRSRLRQVNDRMAELVDPSIPAVQYNGIPLTYVSELDGHGWTNNQPDYFWLNMNWLRPFFHRNKFMEERITDGGSRQPNSLTIWKFTMVNLFLRSRRRQGRVSAA